jgi:oligopeptide transport system substrate-binding protein
MRKAYRCWLRDFATLLPLVGLAGVESSCVPARINGRESISEGSLRVIRSGSFRRCVRLIGLAAVMSACAIVGGCGGNPNDPYPLSERDQNILYSAFSQRPKHLDPAQAYASDEYEFISQVYEPPLQYHYLKRPYTLVPATLTGMPVVKYFDGANRRLPDTSDAKSVAYTVYELHLRPGIRYAPHPAFATREDGKPAYLSLNEQELEGKRTIRDFPLTGTRELVARDYIHQIKRLAHPRVHSPILGHMSDYIVGLKELSAKLLAADRELTSGGKSKNGSPYLDLEAYPLSGVTEVDRYTWQIRVKGKYPQFAYWLAMPFFAPMPPEADRFYAQKGMAERNVTLDWYPVGTGPYMLTENDPNSRMVMDRNPNYRGEPYPAEGEASDAAAGLLVDAGKVGPFIDKIVFTREKESIPYWNKFLQGYYDQSGISNDNFDNAVRISNSGDTGLSEEMVARGIRLRTSVATSTYYLAFNWLDAVVGGQGDASQRERAKRLRQAISMAIDFDEFISIFANGRGIPGQGPIPPGLFGFRDGEQGINPVVYRADQGKPVRKPIEEARKLLALAGYAGGRDARTGQPLVLYLDTTAGGPGDKARLDWYRKQFQKLGIQLDIRTSDWNRFQEKVRKGNTQMFFLGWNADYPDPENFLFLLYGPNAAVRFDGENKANYQNPEYDRLFEQMKNMTDGPQREAIIDRMVGLLRDDAPWVWGFHPKDYGLYHAWLRNVKPNQMARNGIKFYRIDVPLREKARADWNRPRLWPLGLLALIILVGVFPAYRLWRQRERRVALRQVAEERT